MTDIRWSIVALIVAALVGCCYSQNATLCEMAATCAECIETGPSCAWCAQNDYGGVRCSDATTMQASNCTDVQNPEAFSINVTKDEPLSNAGDAALGEAVQVKPQEIRLKLRKGETARIEMEVRQAEDYPVDLYYLMDLSESMAEDLVALTNIAGDLVIKMQELTRDFRVGFGSFVDKTVSPFAAFKDNGEIKLCEGGCAYPYLFKNGLSLTSNTSLFEPTLRSTPYSTSDDAPEAGFDALLQVAACTELIGWRGRSRHLVLFASDEIYHTAGDGRLGGIVKPNDGECHVDETGNYNSDILMDYPSLGHLSAKIQEQAIIPMFVVTSKVESRYRSLLEHIPGAKIGRLAADSTNVVYVIEQLYLQITAEVSLNVVVPDELLVEVTANCQDGASTPGSLSCSGLNLGDTVSFSLDVTAESCVSGSTTSFSASPVGFQEELRVFVDVVCDCECQDSGVPNSPTCNSNGTLVCGQCSCNPGMYGDMCQCSGGSTSSAEDMLRCYAPNSNAVCSGRGQCICGECVCEKEQDPNRLVSGMYCQCDNFNCPSFEGQLCGGPSRGNCICDMHTQTSKCNCTQEYTGDSCNCLRSTEGCKAENGLICNAHGTCECGACRCEASSQFKGPTCSDCATCKGKCEVYQECVQCHDPFNSGPLSAEQCSMCNLEINVVKVFPDVDYPYNCSVTHSDNCSIIFIPHFVNGEDENPVIYVLDETVCPPYLSGPGVDARWVGVGVAIFIVILGILFIILYKLYIIWLYRKEYEEWLRERDNAKFEQNENPLYQPPSSLHKNPAYGAGLFADEKEELNTNNS